jgi:hypothetical protein
MCARARQIVPHGRRVPDAAVVRTVAIFGGDETPERGNE